MADTNLLDILPCASCGQIPKTQETDKPEGRLRDLFRIACTCGRVSPRWSVSDSAAIRLWNETMTIAEKMED